MKKLSDVKSDYVSGVINKQQYISEMHNIHECLFEYAKFIKNTDISKIEILDDSVIMTSRGAGVKMICDKDDFRIAPIEIINFGNYECDDFRMVLNLIRDGFTVFDVGANFGWYSFNIAKSNCNGKIYSFEPIPKTFNYLKSNLALNDIHNVGIFNFGFSNEEADRDFYYYKSGSGNASLVNLAKIDQIEEVRCKVKKMDDFIEDSSINLDFIKCDVEGAELLVFQGGIKSIEKYRPIIFTEILRKWSKIFKYHPNEIVELLSKIGYSCFVVSKGKLIKITEINDDTMETNFFFLHDEKHSKQVAQFS